MEFLERVFSGVVFKSVSCFDYADVYIVTIIIL